jgi:hypothetical protein
VFGGGGSATVRTVDSGSARYRLGIVMFVQNLTNRPNYIGYSGVLTSPFYSQATAVTPMRRINIGFNLSF